QRTFSGAAQGRTVSGVAPSRVGPSHCGQSAAATVEAKNNDTPSERNHAMRFLLVELGTAACRTGGVQKRVQRSIAPGQACLLCQTFEAAQVFFGESLAGLLVGRIAVIDAATEWPRLTGGTKVVFLERAEVGAYR